MIVPSMTPAELTKELFLDLHYVNRKVYYLGKKIIRKNRRIKRFNASCIVEYKSPRKNNWLILFLSEGSKLKYIVAACFLNSHGLNVVSIEDNQRILAHYYSHFFERYNERFVKMDHIRKIELIKRFLLENPYTSFGISKVACEEGYPVKGKLQDGIVLGFSQSIGNKTFMKLKTFISMDMIKEYQQDDIDKLNQWYRDAWGEYPDALM